MAASTRAEMQRPHFLWPGWNFAMGLGWMIRRDAEGDLAVEHGGEVDGHSAFVLLSPAHGVATLVLANLGQDTAEELGRELMELVLRYARAAREPTRQEALCLAFSAQWGEAEWALERVTRTRPEDAAVWFQLGEARYRLHRLDAAARAYERALALGHDPARTRYRLARIHAAAARADEALRWLEGAVAAGLGAGRIRATPEFETLSADPRFRALLRSAGGGADG